MIEKKKKYVGPIPGRILCFTLEEYGPGEHCCHSMNLRIHEKERIILYIAQTREYAVRASDCIVQTFLFCPWCGVRLPYGLRNALFDTIKQEYGLDIGFHELEENINSVIPPEFKTDEWWKKRGF